MKQQRPLPFAPSLVVLLWILLAVCLPPLRAQQGAGAQQSPPRLGYLYPAGGTKGATFLVAIGGQYLAEDAGITVSGEGVRVRPLELFRPLTQQEFNKLRDRADELRAKAGITKDVKDAKNLPPGALEKLTDEERRELADIRRRTNEGNPRRQTNPAIAETLLVEVVVDAGAAEGTRELRLRTKSGLSNPMVFRVGGLPEVCAGLVQARPSQKKMQADQQRAVARNELTVTPPLVVNGQILQGGVDRLRFKATKGQRLVLALEARSLIPYLADAVPGWFQATLSLSDAKGRELAYNDDFRFSPDPVLLFEVPEDGEYLIDVKDGIFRGREDFIYRLTIGELPFITGLFPAGGPAHASTRVDVSGWNIRTPRTLIDATERGPGIILLSLAREHMASSPVPFELSEDPELAELEGNDSAPQAQVVKLPVVVNGRISRPDDRDWFRFEGAAGEEIVVELLGRRLNSPIDSQLRLVDSQGNQVAFNDDHEDRAAGLSTHHADSYLRARLPQAGSYLVELSDVQHQGGEANSYRLHLHRARPDFELRCEPSAVNVREGEPAVVTVFVLRRDGFDGPIRLTGNVGSKALGIDGAVIPAGVDRLRVTLSPRFAAHPELMPLRLSGNARLPDGKLLVREAVPCDDMMQAFIYRHLVVAQSHWLKVLPKLQQRPVLRQADAETLVFRDGKTCSFLLPLPRPKMGETLRCELSDPPEGITVKDVDATGSGVRVRFAYDPAKAKPGQKGNLIIAVFHEREPQGDKAKGKQKGPRRVPIGYLPAQPYEVAALPAK